VTRLLKSEEIAHVFALDNLSRSYEVPPFTSVESASSRCSIIRSDYQELTSDRIDALQVDVLVHFAASISVDESMVVPEKYVLNNEVGGAQLVERLAKSRTRPHLILASSAEVYGDPDYVPIDIAHPKQPANAYAVTKLAVENHALVANRWYGYPLTILRNFNTFGPNTLPGEFAAVIPKFINAALRDEDLIVFNGGSQTRDFIFVEDAVTAYEHAIHRHATLDGRIFNVGTGVETSIKQLAQLILEQTGSRAKLVELNGRPADLARLCADVADTKQALDWEPRHPFAAGLERTIAWHQAIFETTHEPVLSAV
jgi:UDP-glucose 4-epimerase